MRQSILSIATREGTATVPVVPGQLWASWCRRAIDRADIGEGSGVGAPCRAGRGNIAFTGHSAASRAVPGPLTADPPGSLRPGRGREHAHAPGQVAPDRPGADAHRLGGLHFGQAQVPAKQEASREVTGTSSVSFAQRV